MFGTAVRVLNFVQRAIRLASLRTSLFSVLESRSPRAGEVCVAFTTPVFKTRRDHVIGRCLYVHRKALNAPGGRAS